MRVDETNFCELMQSSRQKAFQDLYDRFAPALLGEITRYVGDMHTAEDILQEVFISVHLHADQYDNGKGRLFTWLINITRHKCIDHCRSPHFRRRREIMPLEDQAGSSPDTSATALDSQLVRRYLFRYRPSNARLVEWIYGQGCTNNQAALLCELPVGTVKTRIRKTLAEVRSSFASQHQSLS